MNIRIRNELIPLNLLVVILIIATTLLPSNILRIVLGLPFLIFFPGYALVAALFPRREGLDAIERVALSFGMSIVVVPLIGLILNYTPLGIRLEPTLYSVSAFTVAISTIAWLRRRRLPQQQRFGINFQLRLPGWGGDMRVRILSVILAIAILGALGVLGYVIATPKMGERFTEFYILGESGKAADYPLELKVGDTGKVVVGIINHEYQDMHYRVEVRSSGVLIEKLEPVMLAQEQKWEQLVKFILLKVGEKQKVEFVLYNNGEPYIRLHLWVSVIK